MKARTRTRARREFSEKDSDFLTLARERFKQASQAEHKQREREQSDLGFYAGDQWPADVLNDRQGQAAGNGMPPVPARPCLTINKLREPIHQVLNQERQNDYAFQLIPADDWGGLTGPIDHTEIEVREGLVRRIQRESEASDARTWAFNRAVIAGRGYYRIITRYVSDKSADLELAIQRIYNQASVTLDPSHEQPDGSDAEWGFIGTDMPIDQYESEFGKLSNGRNNPLTDATLEEFRALGDEMPGWFTTDDKTKTRTIRVVDYFHTERKNITVVHLADGRAVPEDQAGDLPRELEDGQPITRRVDQKVIKIAKIDGTQKLDEVEWVCPFPPIVKVLGEELQPYDKERRVEGMVRPGRSSQEGFNYMISKMVETVGLAPIPPWMVVEGQIEGYESWYEAANTRALPYLPWKQTDLEGRPAGRPERTPVDTPISAISGSLQVFNETIKSTTGVPDATMGNVDPSIRQSGKAIRQLLEQSAKGFGNYLDNLARSIRYEAKVINAALPVVYGRPGRITQMVNAEGKPQSVMLHQPFVMQGQNGNSRPVSAPNDPNAKTYALTRDADFNITVKVVKDPGTLREEEASQLGELISAEPSMMTWFGDLFFENQDGPGHQEMANRAKLMLAPPIQQSLSGQQPIPPQVQAKMAQMQQMHDMLAKELEAKTNIIETDQIKAQHDIDKAKIDQQTRIEVARIQQEGAFAVADLKAGLEAANVAIAEMREIRAAFESTQKHVHTAAEQGRDHAHELIANAQEHRHELQQNEQEHAQALEQGVQAHAQTLEQGQQAADLAPEPAAGA